MDDPKGQKIKLLVTIASYGTKQDPFLERLVQGYQKMSYRTDIVVLSNIAKPVPAGVELIVGLPNQDPWSLPFAHKKVMVDRLEDYDLFIYSENDTMVCENNISAFLRVSEALPENEIPGFLRYENGPGGARNFISAHGHYHWDPSSVITRGPYTFAFFTNEHAALYLLTQKQLRHCINSGEFLIAPYRGKYDLACTAATDPYTRCGFRKLICISDLEDFLIHHMPDKYTGPNFSVHDQEFAKQVAALLAIGRNGGKPSSLLETETRLPDAKYSKDYYEPLRQEVVSEIPHSVCSVLSVGSGSGTTEKYFVAKGLRVAAIPLDPVIAKCLEDTPVEIVPGDFAAALAKLRDRKFDCLFLSNILHLLPNPSSTLAELCELLAPGGYVLVVTPNIANLKNSLYRLLGKAPFQNMGDYARGGAQNVSRRALQEWFRLAGCSVERFRFVTSPSTERISRFAPALFDSLLGSEIIALAKKAG